MPGEIHETDYLPVYKSGISLEGTVQISLPIDTPPDSSEYDPETHPENFDADGLLIQPEKGVITFELDTKDILSQVRGQRQLFLVAENEPHLFPAGFFADTGRNPVGLNCGMQPLRDVHIR